MIGQSLPNAFRPSVLLAIGFAILVAIGAGTVWLVNAAEQDAQLVAHTFEVQSELNALLRFVRRAESGERGYIITGDAADFEVYRTGAQGVEAALADLRRLTVDDPSQQAELEALEPVLRARLDDMPLAIEASRKADRDGILAIISRGRTLQTEISGRVERMMATEQRLLATRSAEASETNRRLLAVTILGLLLVMALAALSVYEVRRSTRALQQAHRELETANASLEETVAERTAELRESNEEIQRYAYIVSHDLRAPLVNVMGFTSELEALKPDLLSAGAKPESDPERVSAERDFDESIGFIKAATAKMDGLIGAILKISREGRRAFRPEPLDMNRVVQGLADAQRHQAEAAGASVVVGDLPPVTADRLAIEQIFANLIDNAIKYLDPSRPGRIEVTGAEAGPRVHYEVRDNGRGISPQDHARVFELFRRAGVQDRPG